jgi:hypothetical protein
VGAECARALARRRRHAPFAGAPPFAGAQQAPQHHFAAPHAPYAPPQQQQPSFAAASSRPAVAPPTRVHNDRDAPRTTSELPPCFRGLFNFRCARGGGTWAIPTDVYSGVSRNGRASIGCRRAPAARPRAAARAPALQRAHASPRGAARRFAARARPRTASVARCSRARALHHSPHVRRALSLQPPIPRARAAARRAPATRPAPPRRRTRHSTHYHRALLLPLTPPCAPSAAPSPPLRARSYFNSMQSELFAAAWGSDRSLAVSAPTGSGKTVVFELALLRMLSAVAGCVDPSGAFVRRPGRVKAVYVAPMRVRTHTRTDAACRPQVRARRVCDAFAAGFACIAARRRLCRSVCRTGRRASARCWG